MKKIEQTSLLLITVLFLGLMIGVLAGRCWPSEEVVLSTYDRMIIEASDKNQVVPAEKVSKININIATASELSMLPGIGESYAQRIVDYRNEHGMFASIYELQKVNGIGIKRIESIAEYITVGG